MIFSRKVNIPELFEATPTEAGIQVQLSDKVAPVFGEIAAKITSLRNISLEARGFLLTLEDLAHDERSVLSDDCRSFSLSWDAFYTLLDESENPEDVGHIFQELKPYFPQPSKAVVVELEGNSMIGRPDFFVKASVRGAIEVLGGCAVLHDGQRLILSREQFQLLRKIKQFNVTHVRPKKFDVAEQMRAWGGIASSLPKSGVKLDSYLKNETEYVPLEEIQIDTRVEAETGDVTLLPRISDDIISNEQFNKQFNDLPGEQVQYKFDRPDGGRRRLIPSKEVNETLAAIKQKPTYKKAEVPKLFDPERCPIPNVDKFGFSDRVVGIGVYVYRPTPYLEVDQSQPGQWFEASPGINLRPTPLNDQTSGTMPDIPDMERLEPLVFKSEDELQQFKSQIEKARGEGKEYLELKPNHFVPIEAAEQQLPLIQEAFQSQKEKGRKLQYVLQIYQNVSDLEYSQMVDASVTPLENSPAPPLPPPDLHATSQLKSYQEEAYRWLYWLSHESSNPLRGALLADDMGLGKTFTVLSLLSALNSEKRLAPALVIVPKTLIPNWFNEAKKYFPSLAPRIKDLSKVAKMDAEFINKLDVVITNFEQVNSYATILGKVDWKAILIDEAQRIKTTSTKISNNVKGLKGHLRVAMTGTPIENTLADLWNIMDWVQPGLLRSYSEFKETFGAVREGDKAINERLRQQLESQMNGCFKRRVKKDVEDLPPRTDQKYKVPLTATQMALYHRALEDFHNSSGKGTALKALQSIAMISTHPALVDGSIPSDVKYSARLIKALAILKEIQKKGEKAIIFARVHKAENIVQQAVLDEFGFAPEIVNGETHNDRKLDLIKTFEKKDGFNVIILGLKACGYGLTVTGANHVIHYERWWNPAVEDQANCRVYRIGQKRPVTIHHILTQRTDGKRSFDEILDDIHNRKQGLADNFLTPNPTDVGAELSKEMFG